MVVGFSKYPVSELPRRRKLKHREAEASFRRSGDRFSATENLDQLLEMADGPQELVSKGPTA